MTSLTLKDQLSRHPHKTVTIICSNGLELTANLLNVEDLGILVDELALDDGILKTKSRLFLGWPSILKIELAPTSI